MRKLKKLSIAGDVKNLHVVFKIFKSFKISREKLLANIKV